MLLIGAGKVPVSMIIGIFLLCWGSFGLLSNQMFGVLKYPAVYIWPSVGVTFVASSVLTRSLAAVMNRLIPEDQTYGVSRLELVGSPGRTVYTTSKSAGTIHVKDKFGTVHRLQAKTEAGDEPIPSGAAVIVVDFDCEDNRFVVRKNTI
jgi:membrane-bound ClpP family serine protease